ncbi:hypothetical protein Aca07nite_38140 [Actinoplanes capillaceus]|uniref:Aldehyde dehydrogenase family protein n=1 Tax=Actinoplanes campanulatus TaxID=113559 RepID=A0ABQ3WJW4_9ACTN|nr:hypothetical protein [Actinoplanes capillaceus]GID46539.1 hypothetical protein Aca07nite_38140 [Actinoplanes capillaceus]
MTTDQPSIGGRWVAPGTGETIGINGAAFNPLAPFGGYKQSGPDGSLEFTRTKAIQL